MPATVILTGSGVETSLIGGKASSLDRLIAVGCPVPLTGALTTDGYRHFVRSTGITDYLDKLRASPPPLPEQYERLTAEVDRAFLDAPMPDDLEEEIRQLWTRVRAAGRLAVRSSATAEDMSEASFAGQYRSFLELDTIDEVLQAVRLVWASLWHPAPRSYRRFRGIDESDLAMAVVIMQLVEADLAGVVFTRDPGGAEESVRMEAVEGLAEKLVSGEVTPDAYVVPRVAPRPGLAEGQPILNRVVDMALEVERSFGAPQDVEWAYDGTTLYLVQARPITTTPEEVGNDDGFDTATPDDLSTFTTAGIAEMVPGQLPPLLWTINGTLLEEAFRSLFDGLGALPDNLHGPHAMIVRHRGRAALNLDLLKDAAAKLPGGSSDELERQYFGRVISDQPTAVTPTKSGPLAALKSLVQGGRETAARNRFAREAETVVAAVDRIAAGGPVCENMTDEALIAYRRRLLDMGGRTIAAEVAVAAAAAAAYRGVEMFLQQHIGDEEAALLAQQLTTGGINTCGGQTILGACVLVDESLDQDAREIVLQEGTPNDLRQHLGASTEGRDFLDFFDQLLYRAGSASIFAGPTWAEDEELAWQVMRQAIAIGTVPQMQTEDDRAERLTQLEDELTKTWKWRLTRVFTGQVVDIRKRMFRRLVQDAVEFLDRRERSKTAVLRLGGEVRRVHRSMAARLHARDRLSFVEDVDLLSSSELEETLRGSGPSMETIVRRRRQHAQAATEGPLPAVFTGRPAAAEVVRITGDSFEGWGGSPGRHTAIARVLDNATDRLERGDILVARTTDPSWTPLFLTAGAIIVEEGGPLSHAAIVARELGLPAVLNIPGIVERLRGGEPLVTVDGTKGHVTVQSAEEKAA
jgi:pyruvate,water dikinase